MPKISRVKTTKELDALKRQGNYPVGGVEGLYLKVSPAGYKSHVLRYTVPGTKRRTMIGLGSFKAKSLAEVRREAFELREQLAKGCDPLLARKQAREEQLQAYLQTKQDETKEKAKSQHTVEFCVTKYLDLLSVTNC